VGSSDRDVPTGRTSSLGFGTSEDSGLRATESGRGSISGSERAGRFSKFLLLLVVVLVFGSTLWIGHESSEVDSLKREEN